MNWSTTTTLYAHQTRAVDKLRRSRVGGLFMEMGTGKTRAAIELVQLRRERIDRVVWFCPVANKETIRYEIEKHTHGAAVYVFNDRTTADNLPAADWYVVGIESMSSSNRVTLAVAALITDRSFVIVDESSYIKTHNSRRTARITMLSEQARYRLILTGTPVSEGIVDLFAQMRFLSTKILGYRSFHTFASNHLVYSVDQPGRIIGSLNTAWLAAKIQPYTYQVTKAECLDLPRKLYETRYCAMTAAQQERYQQAKEEILFLLDQAVTENERTYVLFQLFGALQQIVCGYWNRRDPWTDEQEMIKLNHNRIEALLGAVRDVPTGERVIIWSKYHYSIRQIVAALQQEFGPAATAEFHGHLSEAGREAELTRWRTGPARFLVATQAAGGHGLTLNEAHYVVFYSNEFKYSTRAQAEDRCHRIGQEYPVTYIDIVCAGTIDDRISSALVRKADAAREFRRQVNAVKDDKAMMKEMIQKL